MVVFHQNHSNVKLWLLLDLVLYKKTKQKKHTILYGNIVINNFLIPGFIYSFKTTHFFLISLASILKNQTWKYFCASLSSSYSLYCSNKKAEKDFISLPFCCLKTMQAVNKKMDPQKTLKTMQDFQKENMKMGMTEDMSKRTWCTNTCGVYKLLTRI